MMENKKQFLIIVLSGLFIILFSLVVSKRQVYYRGENNLPQNLSGELDFGKREAIWHQKKISIPPEVFMDIPKETVLGLVPKEDRWIEVDLSEQKLKAWENGELFLESAVSTGLPWWPTPQGEFTIWLKVRASTMEGGEGKYYYYLPNVPYVMYFEGKNVPRNKGYGLHGTYWHNDFGRVHSHGCVNLPTPIAKKLYYWTYPMLSNNQKSVYATEDNPGTKIVIHE